jgi:D-alanyl-D-alanine carboxypeptidase
MSVRSVSLVMAVALLGAVPPSGSTSSPNAKLQEALDQLVAAGAPGAIAFAREGNRTIRVTSGYGNLKTRTPIRATDRFRVGSVTKTFVATVVLQLAAEGKLRLHDTVEQWLPGLVPNGENITIRLLLNMRAGLFDYLNDGDQTVLKPYLSGNFTKVWKPRELVRVAVSHKPPFAPGTRWHYCNTCYVLLGLIVEKASGNSLGTELRRRIFTPLRLGATTFDTKPRIAGRHTHGYERLGKPPLVDVSVFSPSFGWAAGAVVSTADEVARFYRALLGGRLLRPDLLREMRKAVPLAPKIASGYGLGILHLGKGEGRALGLASVPCASTWGHDGGAPGYRTWALNSKDGRRQIVVFTNLGEESLSKRATQALDRVIATAYCG